MTDTGLILLESDIAGVVQAVLDVPVASDCGGGMARRYGGIGHIVGNLGGAAPEAGLGISMQDIAGDADNGLDQWFPLGPSDCGVGAEYFGSPGFVSAAPGGDLGVAAGGVAGGSAMRFSYQKRAPFPIERYFWNAECRRAHEAW